MNYDVTIALDAHNALGEGVLWSSAERRLYWVDIDNAEFWRFDPRTRGKEVIRLEEAVTSFAFRAAGGLLVARERGLSLWDPDSGKTELIRDLIVGEPEVRLNDGRCDRQGRFVVSGLDKEGQKRGRVFSTDAALDPKTILDGIDCGNSTCFSTDGTKMYFADSPRKVIWVFDYDVADGTPHNRRVFSDLHERGGSPDGSTIDAEDHLWNAQWGASRVVRYDPKGRIVATIDLPCRFPTCPAFGGENLDVLYVTSARRVNGQGSPLPNDGALLAIRTDVQGLDETPFCF